VLHLIAPALLGVTCLVAALTAVHLDPPPDPMGPSSRQAGRLCREQWDGWSEHSPDLRCLRDGRQLGAAAPARRAP
jgi:hypothetical protein